MKTSLIFFTLITTFTIISCDVIETNYRKEIVIKDPVNPTNQETLSTKRIVLLEKFTGAACAPCPEGNDEAKRLVEVYRDVNVISYHAGIFAKPVPSEGFIEDFRTDIGNELGMAFFKPTSPENIQTPLAAVDRTGYDTVTTIRLTFRNWDKRVSYRDTLPSPIAISLFPWYDSSNNTITVSGIVTYLEQGFKDYRITLALVEDSIIKPQKQFDGSKDVNYVHKSVFRANIPNTTWGSELSFVDQPKNSQVTFTRTLQFNSNSDWNIKHLKVVGYVYRYINFPFISREVLQSKSEKVSIVP